MCACTVPAARQPSLPLAMPFYSSAEPAQAALHSGYEGGKTQGREGGRNADGRREEEMKLEADGEEGFGTMHDGRSLGLMTVTPQLHFKLVFKLFFLCGVNIVSRS